MRYSGKLPILFLIIIGISACFKSDTPKVSSVAKPFLEINENARGTRDVTGRTLFLRLYDDGTLELEFPDDGKRKSEADQKAEDINTLHKTKADEEKFRQILNLLKTQDFANLKGSYPRKCCCTDAFLDYDLNILTGNQWKNIKLDDYCIIGELTDPNGENSSAFPQQISELFRLADNLRHSNIPR